MPFIHDMIPLWWAIVVFRSLGKSCYEDVPFFTQLLFHLCPEIWTASVHFFPEKLSHLQCLLLSSNLLSLKEKKYSKHPFSWKWTRSLDFELLVYLTRFIYFVHVWSHKHAPHACKHTQKLEKGSWFPWN